VSAFELSNGDGECGLLVAYKPAYSSSRMAWSKGWQPPGTVLNSLHEPGELSKDYPSTIILLLINY